MKLCGIFSSYTKTLSHEKNLQTLNRDYYGKKCQDNFRLNYENRLLVNCSLTLVAKKKKAKGTQK